MADIPGYSATGPVTSPVSPGFMKRNGTYYATPLVAMAYGLISTRDAELARGTMVALTDAQAAKFLKLREKELHGDVVQSGGGNATGTSPLAASRREGRVSATGKPYGFGTRMKTARGGGLIQAANGTFTDVIELVN